MAAGARLRPTAAGAGSGPQTEPRADPHLASRPGSPPRSLRITGWAYVPAMDIARRRNTTKLVVLVPRGRRRPPLVLPARPVHRPDVTAASGQDRYSYDWSGFSCDISARLFRTGRRWLTGTWDCFVLVRGRAVWRPARLHVAGPLPGDPGPREIAPGLILGAQWTGGRLQVLAGRRPDAEPGRQAAPVRTEPAMTEPL